MVRIEEDETGDIQIHFGSGPKIFAVLLIAVMFLFFSLEIVPEGHVGVKTQFGKAVGDELEPGLNIVLPIIEDVKVLSTRSHTYTMSGGEGDQTVEALTSEGLNLETLDISVRYHMEGSHGKQVYSQLGLEEEIKGTLLRPTIRSAVRQCTAQFTSEEIYSEARDNLADCIQNETSDNFDKYGFVVERVQIRNIMLPSRVRKAIQKKIEAEQEIQQTENQIQVAKKEAERKRAEARGIADSNRIIGSSLSDAYLRWYWIQEGLQKGDAMYVPVGQGGLPMFKDVDNVPSGSANFTQLAQSNASIPTPGVTSE